MKKVLIAAIALVVLVIAIVVISFLSIDSIAKAAIEKGGTYALGVPTTLDSANVGIMAGKFSMSGLKVANPAGGYTSPAFLSLGSGGVSVSFTTLKQPVVELPTFSLENLDVSLEKKDSKANYAVILDNLNKLKAASGGGGASKPAPSSDSEKRFVIKELLLRNIKISVDLIGGPGAIGKLTKINIPIDEIKLENVGQTGTGVGGTGVTMSQLASIIVQAVLAAAADKGGGLLPADILGDLKGGLANLGDLDKLGMNVLAKAPAELEKQAEKAIDDATKKLPGAAGDAVKDLTKNIPGLKK